MEHYLAERYVPAQQRASLTEDVARMRAIATSTTRLLQTFYVPEDEVCFLLFESESAELVERTGRDAGLELGRVLAVVELGEDAP